MKAFRGNGLEDDPLHPRGGNEESWWLRAFGLIPLDLQLPRLRQRPFQAKNQREHMTIELESSLHQFKPDDFGSLHDFLSTTDKDERDTLLIACSDHGTAPDNVSFAGTDRFLILQHLAECVPPPEDRESNDLFGSIELGFSSNNLRHAIVCGHLSCGVIRNWLKDSIGPDIGGLQARFRSTVVKAVDETYPELTSRDYIERLICEHALFQLENLQMHPLIRERLDAKQLKLHLWIVNDQTARILAYNPHIGDLVPIEEMR